MYLNSQKNLINKLYNDIINSNNFTIINVVGEKGSGKHIIINGLVNRLMEGWDFHYINGINSKNVAREPIKIKKCHEFFPIPSLSIKLGLLTIGGSLRFQEADSIFNDIEKKFIKEINEDLNRSLIIIENYNYLDDYTKKFVDTLLSTNEYFKKKEICFLISSETPISSKYNIITVDPLCLDDIKQLICEMSQDQIDADKIFSLSKGNLELTENLIKYGSHDEKLLEEIIHKRILDVKNVVSFFSEDEIFEICTYGTYFLNGFTLEQIFKIYNKKVDFDNLFKLFINLNKIGIVNSNNQLINYDILEFKRIINKKNYDFAELYLNKFYEFYTNNYDYLYDERLTYILELYKKNKLKDYLNSKITGLLFVCTILKIYDRTITDSSKIKEYLDKKTNSVTSKYSFPKSLYSILLKIINKTLSYEDLNSLNLENEDVLVKMEILRLSILLLGKKTASTEAMNELITFTIDFLEHDDNVKIEVYAKLRIMDTLISQLQNRSTLYHLSNKLLEKYNNLIRHYEVNNPKIHNAYKYLKYRRTSLYDKCDISIQKLQDAIAFYSEENNIYELYYCYVNLLGLYVITGRESTSQCIKVCNEIQELIDNNDVIFEKKYKYKNNLLLQKLNEEIKKTITNDEYIDVIKRYSEQFKDLYNDSHSKVVKLNYISLLSQINNKEGLNYINEFLIENGNEHNLDSFYKYNLNNLKIIIYIINNEWSKAKQLLEYLYKIEMPNYNLNAVYFTKRLDALKLIISKKIKCNSIKEYNNLIKNVLCDLNLSNDYFNGLDESWDFFSRSFIMSDLQFFD